MTTIMVDIPKEINKNIGFSQHIDIIELFDKFGIDLEFVLKEKKYSKSFSNDIKNKDFVVNNRF